jgi:hypothetical protein
MPEQESKQSMVQKKIALAGSEHAPIIIELMKDLMQTNPIIGKTQWDTIVNALTLEIQSDMLRGMVDYLEKIRKGELHEPK